MGLLDVFGIGRHTRDLLAPGIDAAGIKTPWAEGEYALKSVVWSDILGEEAAAALPFDRSAAISIPAVSKARNLLISTIGKLPLVALNKDGVLDDEQQPSFLYRTDSAVTPYERLCWTIDDFIFWGYSLWEVTRGSNGQILTANWVPQREWKITERVVMIRDEVAKPEEYLFFNSTFEGLLHIANRTLQGARDIEKAWVGRVRNPIPITVLHSTDEAGLEQDEIDSLLSAWGTGRRNPDGALGYLPSNVNMETHGDVSADLFVEGRNASRTDIGSFLNIPVAMLDGTIGVDSLTYSTTEGTRNRFYEESVPFWTDPIEARLSVDDVVPRGQRVRFDKTEAYALIQNPTDAPEQD